MTRFEYLFTLFGLLLGFILVEVLSGLVRTIQSRHSAGPGNTAQIHIGLVTPLLGAFVLLDITGWWGNVWAVHETLPLGYDTMFGGVALCGIYYFAASMVFPDKPSSWPDHDDWFWLHRRQVLGCILAANIAWAPVVLTSLDFRLGLSETLNYSFYFGALIVAIVARRRWQIVSALSVLILQSLALGVMDFVNRLPG